MINAYQLGATLFVPSTHKNLDAIAMNEKFTALQSMVIDSEDGIDSDDIEIALKNIENLLRKDLPSSPLRFIRAKNVDVLKQILEFEGIEKIDGFVLAKFDDNAKEYLHTMSKNSFYFMPSIEGVALFNLEKLNTIREKLVEFKSRIICVRFGAEDMLKALSLQREKDLSLYDMLLPSRVITDILLTFKPYGFDVSAPVYKYFKDEDGFKKELKYELKNGFVSKTVIHPNQIEWLRDVYRVSDIELNKAKKILDTSSVGSFKGEMLEKTTQSNWAERIFLREKIYN